jgi:hypothetical protein
MVFISDLLRELAGSFVVVLINLPFLHLQQTTLFAFFARLKIYKIGTLLKAEGPSIGKEFKHTILAHSKDRSLPVMVRGASLSGWERRASF